MRGRRVRRAASGRSRQSRRDRVFASHARAYGTSYWNAFCHPCTRGETQSHILTLLCSISSRTLTREIGSASRLTRAVHAWWRVSNVLMQNFALFVDFLLLRGECTTPPWLLSQSLHNADIRRRPPANTMQAQSATIQLKHAGRATRDKRVNNV